MRRILFFAPIVVLLGIAPGRAAISAKSQNLIVLEPKDLPAMTQAEAQSIKLHTTPDGSTYLYIEQYQMKRIVVLDVTDPSKIKALAPVALDVSALPVAFDFNKDLDYRTVLLRLRDGKGAATLDLRQPKQPKLTPADPLFATTAVEDADKSVLVKTAAPAEVTTTPHDYQIIDSSNPLKPQLLTTVLQVSHQVSDPVTGTTYLLGSAGLTVVRRPDLAWQPSQGGN